MLSTAGYGLDPALPVGDDLFVRWKLRSRHARRSNRLDHVPSQGERDGGLVNSTG